jgi:hypothetical protein
MLGLLGTACAPAHAAKQGVWTTINDPGELRELATATLLKDGRVLVAGGEGYQGVLPLVELFDPTTDTYSAAAPLQTQRDQATATRLRDGRVLLVGGTSDNVNAAPLSSAEIYDPATGTWTYTGQLHQARFGHQAVLLKDGRVMVMGGTPDVENQLTTCEIWNPKTGKWTYTGSMAVGRRYSNAVALPDGDVLEAGDDSPSEVYATSTGKWSYTGSSPSSAFAAPVVLLKDGTVLTPPSIVGNDTGVGATYDAATNTWTRTKSAEGRFYATGTILKNGSVLIAGGCTVSCSVPSVNSVVLYRPDSRTYVQEPPLSNGRESAAAVRLLDGRVLVQGGFTYQNGPGPTEIFTP